MRVFGRFDTRTIRKRLLICDNITYNVALGTELKVTHVIGLSYRGPAAN